MQISRIRLSDRTSRLHPRLAPSKCGQPYETEVPVQVREGISPTSSATDLVLDAEPPTQPRSGVVVECPIRATDGAYVEVVRPPAQRAVQLLHQLRGLLPRCMGGCQRMHGLDHAPDALLRGPHAQIGFAGRPFIQSPKRVPQEVKAAVRNPTDACLLLVDRKLQSSHE